MIEVAGAGHSFDGRTWLFREYTLAARAGEVVAFLGPNGRGKTTLLKAMLGLIPLAEGRAAIHGVAVYVPQFTAAVFPYRVMDMVLMGRARHIGLLSGPGPEDREIARRALADVGMSGYAERRFDELSGGERQMVIVARALASECTILVLDEPTSALDFRNQSEILAIMRRLADRDGLGVVFTTHFPQHALHVADKALLMFGGADHAFGPAGAVLSEENLSRLYELPVRRLDYDHAGAAHATVVPVFAEAGR